MREFERVRGLEGVKEREEREVFVERKRKSYEECEEIREMKRMKKKKKRLVIVGKNENVGTHLMAKLCILDLTTKLRVV